MLGEPRRGFDRGGTRHPAPYSPRDPGPGFDRLAAARRPPARTPRATFPLSARYRCVRPCGRPRARSDPWAAGDADTRRARTQAARAPLGQVLSAGSTVEEARQDVTVL